MAKKKEAELSKTKKGKITKNEKLSVFGRIKKFFGGLGNEIKRVVWPSRKEVKETTVVVLLVVAFVMVLVFVIDNVMVGVLDLMGFNTAPMPTTAPNTISTTVEESTETTIEEVEETTVPSSAKE